MFMSIHTSMNIDLIFSAEFLHISLFIYFYNDSPISMKFHYTIFLNLQTHITSHHITSHSYSHSHSHSHWHPSVNGYNDNKKIFQLLEWISQLYNLNGSSITPLHYIAIGYLFFFSCKANNLTLLPFELC